MSKLPITGKFSNKEVHEDRLGYMSGTLRAKANKALVPKHVIPEHPGFELVKLKSGKIAKLAYRQLYPALSEDLDIELLKIRQAEKLIETDKKRTEGREKLKFHYKKAISLISPKVAAGWNRWSENMLELFIRHETHKIIWGSGNCGKSQVMAALLYTKWRVAPHERMMVIASKVSKEADARVFGYIKSIHIKAPRSAEHEFKVVDTANQKGIYCLMFDEKTGRFHPDEQACIVSLPIKTDAKREEIGANLLGKHPRDRLIIAFDEAQELPASLLGARIFLNWYTNERLDIYAWGNPQPINYNAPEEWDLLFKIGAERLSLAKLKEKEKDAKKTSVWKSGPTITLHLAMTDSPKDDEDEVGAFVVDEAGVKRQRLSFLGGKENVDKILEVTAPNTPSYYSQVLGFPFLYVDHSKNKGVVTSVMSKEAALYPLMWRVPEKQLQYFMGVDPSISGKNDAASICVGRIGLMQDGRVGIDLMKGEGCRQVKLIEGQDFTDTIIETMYSLSGHYGIPLKNIAIETHGAGEVIRYAIQRHLEGTDKITKKVRWANDAAMGQGYYIVDPTISVTERMLFKLLGHLRPAKEICANIVTEYWVAVRCAFLSRQIFNVPEFILSQMYNRQLIQQGQGAKFKVEGKDDLKRRGVDSPNDADALCHMIDLIRMRGFNYRFYNKGGFVDQFGAEHKAREEAAKAKQVLGAVSRMLQVHTNFEQLLVSEADRRGARRGAAKNIVSV
jgi:hypothetical protein